MSFDGEHGDGPRPGRLPAVEHLRCDAATGALWLNVQREKVHTFRQKSSKGHTKVTRSYCMVLTADGRHAALRAGGASGGEERLDVARTRKCRGRDVPHVNGTLAPDAGFGKKMYDACIARCPCAAPDGRDDFPALSRALLDPDADATQVSGVCFDEGPKYWFHFGWVTTCAPRGSDFYLAPPILECVTLACCVSNRCCRLSGRSRRSATNMASRPIATHLNKPRVAAASWVRSKCRCCRMRCKAQRVKKPSSNGDRGDRRGRLDDDRPPSGGHCRIVVPDDVEEGGVFAVNLLVTEQPLPRVCDNDLLKRYRRKIFDRTVPTLAWKVY